MGWCVNEFFWGDGGLWGTLMGIGVWVGGITEKL